MENVLPNALCCHSFLLRCLFLLLCCPYFIIILFSSCFTLHFLRTQLFSVGVPLRLRHSHFHNNAITPVCIISFFFSFISRKGRTLHYYFLRIASPLCTTTFSSVWLLHLSLCTEALPRALIVTHSVPDYSLVSHNHQPNSHSHSFNAHKIAQFTTLYPTCTLCSSLLPPPSQLIILRPWGASIKKIY